MAVGPQAANGARLKAVLLSQSVSQQLLRTRSDDWPADTNWSGTILICSDVRRMMHVLVVFFAVSCRNVLSIKSGTFDWL